MDLRFRKHYTRDEARALLPQIRQWLERLLQLRGQLSDCDERIGHSLTEGCDMGGETVHRSLRALADSQDVLREFQRREIQIKDLDRGLLDFPAMMGGKEVFLCWEMDEEDIEYWHDLESGYAGREKL